MFDTSLSFELRSAKFGTPHSPLYPTALKMIEFADAHGFDQFILAEHQASQDDHIRIPTLLATAANGRHAPR